MDSGIGQMLEQQKGRGTGPKRAGVADVVMINIAKFLVVGVS
jgi:hypothetical protein